MPGPRWGFIQLGLVLVFLSIGTGVAPALAQSVEETWVGTVNTDFGRANITFHFVKVGEKISGSYDLRGPARSRSGRVSGTLIGEQLDLLVAGTGDSISARVTGDQLSGVFTEGGAGEQRLRATRRRY
jgi:hypothetical protein